MIKINDSPLEISEIINKYAADSIERQLVEQMSESGETYRFDSREQLEFQLALRREIVEAAKALNRSGINFAVFHETNCNPDYWERTDNGGFRLISGVKPSDAILDIYANGEKYATECATAMVIVYYGALLKVLSEETFNRLFPEVYLMNWHALDPLLREAGTPEKVKDSLPGDRGYFKNPEVNPETPELQGENVIVLPEGRYFGHGLGIADADEIISLLNASRKEGATETAYFMDGYAARPNFNKLYKASSNTGVRPASLQRRSFPRPVRS